MKKLLFLLIAFCLLGILKAEINEEKYISFKIKKTSELESLTRLISIDNKKGDTVYAYCLASQLPMLAELGYAVEVLVHPGDRQQVRMVSSIRDASTWDAYPTHDLYLQMMQEMRDNYPEICVLDTFGYSVQNRPLIIMKISDNVDTDEDEPEFLYTSTMHGDETTGFILTLRLIDYLTSNYATDTQVQNIINNVELWINPLANPDGTYWQGDHTVNGARRYNRGWADLNRNFLDFDDGEHPDGRPYQPETLAMMDLANAHNFVLSGNFHGGAEVANYSWDTIPELPADVDWFIDVCREYANHAQADGPPGYFNDENNGITNGYEWYPIVGSRQDYMLYYHHCREVTFELSAVKLLAESQLNNLWDYNKNALLAYIERCVYSIQGTVTDPLGRPLAATIYIQDHDELNSHVKTGEAGDYYRLISPGDYQLRVEADTYQSIENIVAGFSEGTNTIRNFVLEPLAPNYQTFPLDVGWSLVSINMSNDDMQPASVFSSVLPSLGRLISLDEVYDPDMPSHLNTLTTISNAQAYWVNMRNDDTYVEYGTMCDFSSTLIQLQAGWNLLAYPLVDSSTLTTALAAIMPSVIQVKNQNQVFDTGVPAYFNTLDTLEPSTGYWINVSEDCSFYYPHYVDTGANRTSERTLPEIDLNLTPTNTSVVFCQISAPDFDPDSTYILAASEMQRLAISPLVVHVADTLATICVQMPAGEARVDFFLVNANLDILASNINCNLTLSAGETVGRDEPHLFNYLPTASQDDVSSPPAITLQNYPNPFNPTTYLEYYLPTSGNVQIDIYNARGQKILSNSFEKASGKHTWMWKADDQLASGVYLINLKHNGKSLHRKALLMK